jgi:hypothetical protein
MKALCVCLFIVINTSLFGQSTLKDVEEQVEKLRLALIDPTEKNLNDLAADELSFGHSSGKIENKTEFVEALVSGKSNFNKIEFKDQTVTLSGNTALVRHKLLAEIADGDKTSNIAIGILLVWVKQKGTWQLLGRQAYKL